MYNPDQYYEAQSLHLKELSKQAEQRRMIAALPRHRNVTVRAAGLRLGVLLVSLGTWLGRGAQCDEQPA